MKKVMSVVCCLAVLYIPITSILTFASEPQTMIEIEITQGGNIVTQVERGEVFRATVIMTNFPNLFFAHPSLRFDPNVVRVSDSAGRILEPQESLIFEQGEAFRAAGWNGSFVPHSPFPFLRNETGVIGMMIWNEEHKSLVGWQTVFSVYFTAIATGNADIRLTDRRDGEGKANPQDWYDVSVYTDGPNYAMYNWEFDFTNPANPVFDNYVSFTSPHIYVVLPESPAQVFKEDGTRVTNISQLSGGELIYATFDRTNIPPEARLILAVYDNDGRFYASDITSGNRTQNIRVPDNIEIGLVKVFIWEDLRTMNPIYETFI